MAGFDEERLLILERVEAGELTPQEGSLQIAMLKVKSQERGGATADEAGPGGAEGPHRRQPRAPNPIAIGALLLVPFVVMGLIVTVALTFFMALPAYLAMLAWNALLVPSVPGLAEIGFFQTLAMLVVFSLLTTFLRWRRKVKVFMSGGAGPGMPFPFGAGAPRESTRPGGHGLNPGDGFREQ